MYMYIYNYEKKIAPLQIRFYEMQHESENVYDKIDVSNKGVYVFKLQLYPIGVGRLLLLCIFINQIYVYLYL